MNLSYSPVTREHADELVSIRIEAMRESLERIGRFSPERARERFLSSFQPEMTHFIIVEGVKVGFLVVKPDGDNLLLDHLYIVPAHQNKGIGSTVLAQITAEADRRGVSIRAGALKESDSNRFYLSHGFVLVSEEEWDNTYIRPANVDS